MASERETTPARARVGWALRWVVSNYLLMAAAWIAPADEDHLDALASAARRASSLVKGEVNA